MLRLLTRLLAQTFAIGALLIALTSQVSAADQVVNNCSNDTELRNDLSAMQSVTGGTLTFNCGTATIILTGGVLPTITKTTTINGGGKITLSGGNATRLLVINSGVTLTLNNITITKGYSNDNGGAVVNNGTLNVNNSKFLDNHTSTNGGSGGAIISVGPLNITNSEFAYNTAANGGALYPRFAGAVTTITGSQFHHNETTSTSDGWGGAILVWDGARVKLTNSDLYLNKAKNGGAIHNMFSNSNIELQATKVRDNTATRDGGGIYADDTFITLNDVTISGNKASGGGGLVNSRTNASITNTTFSLNQATDGGAIFSYAGSGTLANVTFSGNTAQDEGGALLVNKTSFTIFHVTFSGNSAVEGGAIHHYGISGANVTLKNSIVANSVSGGNCFNEPASAANLDSDGFNLSTDTTCTQFFNQSGDKNNQAALLNLLANNGGPTQTHLPSSNPKSPAIDNGTTAGCNNRDQRGIQRPQGSSCDMGAVEVVAQSCTSKPDKPGLVKPKNNGKVKTTTPLLDWNDTNCATKYTVTARRGSTTGAKAFAKKNLTVSQATTSALVKGETYYWRVTAINSNGKTQSDWWSFKVK
jgi:predicted outer membrane repeat protein